MAKATKQSDSSAAQIVLQWITYGLWFWSLVMVGILLAASLTYFIEGERNYDFTLNALAALIPLLPLALIAERSYGKREPATKRGFAAVVMVLNAVFVFLVTVGASITAIVTLLKGVFDGYYSDGSLTTIVSSAVITFLGGLLFARIVVPRQIASFKRYFSWIIVGLAAATLVLAAVGPLKSTFSNRQDRLIEQNITKIGSAIDSYVYSKQQLPETLDDIDLDGDYNEGARRLVESGTITYKPGTIKNAAEGGKNAPYTLCMTFERAKGTGHSKTGLWSLNSNHAAGRVCVDQTAYFTP